MKLALALVILSSLFALSYSQCITTLYDCSGCLANPATCSWCSNPNSIDYCGSSCLLGTTAVSTCPAPKDLTKNANFFCFSNNSIPTGVGIETASVLGDFAFNLDVRVSNQITDVTAQAIFYLAVGVPNKPGLFGFQYADAAFRRDGTKPLGQGDSLSLDAIAAYYTLYNAFEFVPNNAGNVFIAGTSTVVGTPMQFLGPTVGSCATANVSGVIYNYITFDFGNGWNVNCRLTNSPVTESSGIKLSPVNSKCDVTFGAFTYSGQNNTRLGLTVAFVVGAVSASATTDVRTRIINCPAGSDGICLIVGGAKKAGVFTWAKTTTNTVGVTASGVSAFVGAAADFFFPPNPASSSFATAPNLGSGVSADVRAFAAANVVVYSFANPQPTDVWDPIFESKDASVVDPLTTGTGNQITFSIFLMVIALFARYL